MVRSSRIDGNTEMFFSYCKEDCGAGDSVVL